MGRGNFYLCLCTAPNRDSARKIAEGLVRGKLAACVNIIPGINSIYFWEGKVHDDSEVYLFIKTKESALERVIEYIKGNHPYKLPEIIFFKMEEGLEDYFRWIEENVE